MEGVSIRSWEIRALDNHPENKDFYDSIFSIGNGYMGVRGYQPSGNKENAAERSTFLAGFFEYIRSGITDMVNQPEFSSTCIVLNGMDLKTMRIDDYSETLNMKDGVLSWLYTVSDSEGRKTKIKILKFLSMDDVHGAVIRFSMMPINYDGNIVLETGIEGGVLNLPISDNQLDHNIEFVKLWGDISTYSEGKSGGLLAKTRVSNRATSMEYRLSLCEITGINEEQELNNTSNVDKINDWNVRAVTTLDYAGSTVDIPVKQGNTYIVDKFISVYCYRDAENPEMIASKKADKFLSLGFEQMLSNNKQAWQHIWSIADIKLEASEELQGAVRYNIFQLIQNDPVNDPKASIGARGLIHGRYKGCYFWDTEIFMLPFFLYANPEAAKNLLLYRYHTLNDAVESAKRFTLEGARYSWMASDTGFEQCETWDTGCCEIHITADIAYAIGRYIDVTGDSAFLRDYGTEIFIQTARYWASRFTYDEENDKYNLLFVKGPDEYCGVTANNFYTVKMAVHNLKLALNSIAFMEEKYRHEWTLLKNKTHYDSNEATKWNEIISKAVTIYDEKRSLWIQDETFERQEPIDISLHKDEDSPLYYTINFDRLQRFQVLKQPDVLMLMTLFLEDFPLEQQQAAWDYYEAKTLHDSTLSYGIHGLIAARLGLHKEADSYFNKSLFLDLKDVKKNTGREGIHMAALGATWQALVFGYAGIWAGVDGLICDPHLPEAIQKMEFHIQHRGDVYKVTVEHEKEAIIEQIKSNEKSF